MLNEVKHLGIMPYWILNAEILRLRAQNDTLFVSQNLGNHSQSWRLGDGLSHLRITRKFRIQLVQHAAHRRHDFGEWNEDGFV
jgi:hypothetical protein